MKLLEARDKTLSMVEEKKKKTKELKFENEIEIEIEKVKLVSEKINDGKKICVDGKKGWCFGLDGESGLGFRMV